MWHATRAARPCALLVCVLLLAGAAAAPRAKRDGEVYILTDANFDSLTATGAWLLDIYAPWCSHCQQLEPTWSALATAMKDHGVRVAKVDGTQNRGLMKRFAVAGYPSLYLLRAGQAWQYNGPRSVGDLKDFALAGYRAASPLPFHKAPNSPLGRAIGLVYSLPSRARQGYEYLHEERGLSDASIIAGVLLLPLLVGGVGICLLDAAYTRRHAGGGEHLHYD